MAKKPIEIDVILNSEDSQKKLRELKKALREIPEGTDNWKKVYNEIDDLEDKLKGAKVGAQDWIDTLEGAGGPIGLLGGALNKAKVSFSSFNTALKASVIGLIVTAIGGLVAAFSKSEVATKKLQPLMIQLEKILGGIFRALEPLLDAFIELAEKALPYITEYIGYFYSSLVGLFTLVKDIGVGAGKILKGIFTLDYDALSEGYEQITGSWNNAVKEFTATKQRYDKGVAETTATEKQNAEDRTKAREEELDSLKKIEDAKLEKQKQTALAQAKTDEERFAVEKQFQDKQFQNELNYLNNKGKLYAKGSKERKDIEAAILKLEADRIAQQAENAKKEQEFKNQSLAKQLEAIRAAGDQEVQTQQKVFELKKQLYGEESIEAEKAAQATINSRRNAAQAELDFISSIEKAGGTLTEEQKKRKTELDNIFTQITNDQNALNLTLIRNTANRNVKLNDEEQARLKKISETEKLGFDIRIAALKRLQEELLNDKLIKDQAIDDEAQKRLEAGENEVAVAQWVADRKKEIEKGYKEEVEPLIVGTAELTKNKNIESFNSFLQLGTAISGASQLFKEGSDAARAFAAIQDLVNITNQAGIIITNLQALGILQKAQAETVATTATMAHATAEGVKQGAKVPFPGNIIAIAAIVGAIISIFATIKKLFGAKGSQSLQASASQGASQTTNTPEPYRVVARRASGGIVSGIGSSLSDSNVAAVSDGEFIMNSTSTRRFLPILNRMNEFGKMPQFTGQGFMSSQMWRQSEIGNNTAANVDLAPIRTYVVGQDMTNQQQFDRTIKSRSLI